jgi:hypothetical protein
MALSSRAGWLPDASRCCPLPSPSLRVQAGVADSRWAIEYEAPAADAFKLNNPKAAVFCNNCNAILVVRCDVCVAVMRLAAELSRSQGRPASLMSMLVLLLFCSQAAMTKAELADDCAACDDAKKIATGACGCDDDAARPSGLVRLQPPAMLPCTAACWPSPTHPTACLCHLLRRPLTPPLPPQKCQPRRLLPCRAPARLSSSWVARPARATAA